MKINVAFSILVIGMLLGPVLSPIVYTKIQDNQRNNYESYGLPFKIYNSQVGSLREENFITLNETFLVTHQINDFSVYNKSVYAINEVTGKGYQLLELNMSNNFHEIISAKEYRLTNFIPINESNYDNAYPKSNRTTYSRPVFDGTKFWTVSREVVPNDGLFKIYYRLIAFNKNGEIVLSSLLNMTSKPMMDPTLSIINFLGIYNNYFLIEDALEQNIIVYSNENFTRTLTIPFGLFLNSDSQFTLNTNYNQVNIDQNGYLWFHTQTYYTVAISLKDMISQHFSNIKKAVNTNDLYGLLWTTPVNLLSVIQPYYLDNGTFHGIKVFVDWEDSSIIVDNNNLIYLQYLPTQNGTTVLTGISVNTFVKNPQKSDAGYTNPYKPIAPKNSNTISQDIFLNIFGYIIILSDLAYYWYTRE